MVTLGMLNILCLGSYAVCQYVSFGLCVLNLHKLTTLQWCSTYKPTYCDASPIAHVDTETVVYEHSRCDHITVRAMFSSGVKHGPYPAICSHASAKSSHPLAFKAPKNVEFSF